MIGDNKSTFFKDISELIAKEYGGGDNMITNIVIESDDPCFINNGWDMVPRGEQVHTIRFITVSKIKKRE